jgi:dTDP-4-dehydrorhamnose 3,5-epimerase-like enzyme
MKSVGWGKGYIALIHARAGEREKAEYILQELLEQKKSEFVSSLNFILGYAGLGDIDKVYYWLEKMYEERDPILPQIRRFWLTFDKSIPDDPRFQAILRKMGLP